MVGKIGDLRVHSETVWVMRTKMHDLATQVRGQIVQKGGTQGSPTVGWSSTSLLSLLC